MIINPRSLKYLLEIARSGSLIGAAKSLNIAQPSLSVSIARLEDQLGVKLLDRGRHGARLTEAGNILVRHAAGLETALENALLEVKHLSLGISGPLVVGGTPLTTYSIIPDIFARLVTEFPLLSCRVIEALDETLLGHLKSNKIDVAVCTVSEHGAVGGDDDDIWKEPLFHAGAVAVVRRSNPLAQKKRISLKSLPDALWIMPPAGSSFRVLVESLFAVSGLPFPRNLIEAAPFSVLKEIIRRTDGITILSEQIVRSELAEGSLVSIQMEEQIAPRVFGLQTMKGREPSPIAKRFMEIAREVASTYDISRGDESSNP